MVKFDVFLMIMTAAFQPVPSILHPHSIVKDFDQSLKRFLKLPSIPDSSDIKEDLVVAIANGPIEKSERKFLINGWRWHTKSVVRDLEKFQAFVHKCKTSKSQSTSRLTDCYDFVCGFNWKALMRVEREIFFPWMEELLPNYSKEMIKDIVREHDVIVDLMSQLRNSCSKSVDFTRTENLVRIEEILEQLRCSATRIQSAQVW